MLYRCAHVPTWGRCGGRRPLPKHDEVLLDTRDGVEMVGVIKTQHVS